MRALAVALAALTLPACDRRPQPAAYVKPPIAARYTGVIEQLTEDPPLVGFLRQNQGRAVELEVTIPDREFRGGNDPTVAFFLVFEHCPGDEWPSEGICAGTQIEAPRAPSEPSPLTHEEGRWKFQGQFLIHPESDPGQGLRYIELERLRER